MNTISRRAFNKTALVAGGAGLVGVCGLTIEGCNASQWIQTVLNDMPVILQIITNILQIISAAGAQVAATIITQVQKYGAEATAALNEADMLVGMYNAAAAADRPGILGKIHAALTTAQTNLNAILDVFHVTDPNLTAAIAAGVGSTITLVLAIETLVPPPPTPTPVQAKLASHDERETAKAAFNLLVARRLKRSEI